MRYISNNAAAECVKLFSKMFPNSKIAAQISLQKTKIGYNLLCRLAPYFQNQLLELIKECDNVVICFEESLNKVAKKCQMDVHIRYWDSSKKESSVTTKYYDSASLGHATAENLLDAFLHCVSNINLKKLLQGSMDDPNVNLKILTTLIREYLHTDKNSALLLDMISCGIHTLHNCF